MSYKTFSPENDLFSITIPERWQMEEEEGTFTFCDPDDWKGNFRMTPTAWNGAPAYEKSAEFLDEEMRDNFGAVRQRYGDFNAVHYVKHLKEDEDELSVFYFTLGKGDYIFLFSFTTYREEEKSEETQAELAEAKKAMNSLKLNMGGRS